MDLADECLIKVEMLEVEEEEDPLRSFEEDVMEQKFVIPEEEAPKRISSGRPELKTKRKRKPTKCRKREEMTEAERQILVERDAAYYRRKKLRTQLKLSSERLQESEDDNPNQLQRKSARLRNVVKKSRISEGGEDEEEEGLSDPVEDTKADDDYALNEDSDEMKASAEEALKRKRHLQALRARKKRARMTPEERENYRARSRESKQRERARAKLEGVPTKKATGKNSRRTGGDSGIKEDSEETKASAEEALKRKRHLQIIRAREKRARMTPEERENFLAKKREIMQQLRAKLKGVPIKSTGKNSRRKKRVAEVAEAEGLCEEDIEDSKADGDCGLNKDSDEMKGSDKALKKRMKNTLRERERRARMTPEERENQVAKEREKRARMTPEEREKYNARGRENKRRRRAKLAGVPRVPRPIESTGENPRSTCMTFEERRLEMRYAMALASRRNRPQDYIGDEEQEAAFLELERARFKALEERHRRRYKLPEMTEEERLKWMQKQKEKSEKQSLHHLQRRAYMTEEEKQEEKMRRYLKRQADKARNPDLPPEVKERRLEQMRQWRQSLTGEKLQRYKESLRRANLKQCEKFKQNPQLRDKNETPERKAYKLLRQKLFEKRRKLRKDMRKGGFSEQEIVVEVEVLTKKFCEENPSYTPRPRGKPRKPIDAVGVQSKEARGQSTNNPARSHPRHYNQNANTPIVLASSNISVMSSANQNPQLFSAPNPFVSSMSITSTSELVTTTSSSSAKVTMNTSSSQRVNIQEETPFKRSSSPEFDDDHHHRQAENEHEDEEENGQLDLDSMEASFQDDFDGDYDDDCDNNGGDDDVEDPISPGDQLPVTAPVPGPNEKLAASPKDMKREEEVGGGGRVNEVLLKPEATPTETEEGPAHKVYKWSEICEDCGKTFSNRRKYMNHRRQYHKAPRKCPHPECTFEYLFSKKLLIKHLRQVHLVENTIEKKPPQPDSPSSENSNICPECGKVFKTKCTVDDHIRRVHQGKGFYCDLCRKGGDLQSAGKLWRHKVEKHGMTDLPPPPNLQVRECEYCGEKVLRSYKQHILKKHPEMKHKIPDFLLELEARGSTSKEEEESTTPGFSRCSKCSKEFAKPHLLIRHLRHVHGMGTQTRYPCKICRFEYKQSWVLKKHLPLCLAKQAQQESSTATPSETRQPAYKSASCVLCGAWFFKTTELREHLQQRHPKEYESIEEGKTGEVPLECQHCPESLTQFDDKEQLRKHLESTHPDDSLMKCPNVRCRKVMLSSVELALHMSLEHVKIVKTSSQSQPNSRRKLPPPSCCRCQEQFPTLKEVAAHVALAHPSCYFPCPHCSGIYYSQRVLDFHVILNCRQNADKAKSRKEVADAGRIPIHLVRVKCKVCSAKMAVVSLSGHMKGVHKTIENSFECEHCHKNFKSREFWVSHLENEHETLVESVYDVATEEDDGELNKKKKPGRSKRRRPPSPQKKSKLGRGRRSKRTKKRRHHSPGLDEDDEEDFQEQMESSKKPTRRSQRKVRQTRGNSLENNNAITKPCSIRLVRMSDEEINSYLRQ